MNSSRRAKPSKDLSGRKQIWAERIPETDLGEFQPTQRDGREQSLPVGRVLGTGQSWPVLCPCCDLLSRWLIVWEEGKPQQIQRVTGGDCQLTRPLAAKWQPMEIQVAQHHGSQKEAPVIDPLSFLNKSCFIGVGVVHTSIRSLTPSFT